jgi:hypothetical protein
MERKEDFFISEQMAEWIGLKKSEYLSSIINKQGLEDIGFDQYHLYDSFIPSTIERPDKTYESRDEDHKIRTYIKTFSEKSGFHQLVIGVLIDDEQNKADVFVPIITFVTRDHFLVKEFSVGKVISSPILN